MASIPTNGYAEVMAGTNNYSGSNSFDGSCPRTAIPPVIGDDLTNKTYVDNATGGGILGTITDKGSLITGDGTQAVIFDQNPYQTALTTTTVYEWSALAIGQSRQFTTTAATTIPLGAGITITYSGTDSIKGNITAVVGNTITITITAVASAAYVPTTVYTSTPPAGVLAGSVPAPSFNFTTNPTVSTPNPPIIPANTMITDGISFVHINTTPTNFTVNLISNPAGTTLGSSTPTPASVFPNPNNFQFVDGAFVSTPTLFIVQIANLTQSVNFSYPIGGGFTPPDYCGQLNGYSLAYSTGSIVIDDDICLIADALSSTGLAWGVINAAAVGAVTSVSGGVNIVMSGTVPAPVVNLRNPLTAELNMGSQSLRDSASSVGTSGQVLSAGTGGQTLWTTGVPSASIAITDTNTNATFYPTFVAGAGVQPLLADIATTQVSLNPSNGNFNVVDTVKLTQSELAIGKGAGATTQGTQATAVGQNAGQTNQAANCVAIGSNAGVLNQQLSAVAVGAGAGNSTQGQFTVAIGVAAGSNTQGTAAVAIGNQSGFTTQGNSAVAIGGAAGTNNQGIAAVAVGSGAGGTTQATNAVAVGVSAGNNTQGASAVAIGNLAGQTTQGANSVAIGNNAGNSGQLLSAVAVGRNAGQTTQGDSAVAVGNSSGNSNQSTNAVAIGASAGQTSQGVSAVAIGTNAGNNGQFTAAVAVGTGAGLTTQGQAAVAVGQNAGSGNQGTNAVAIGRECANTTQGASAVSIGNSAGQTSQGDNAVAVGHNAGQTTQGVRGIAIGFNAGNNTQSADAVAIGHTAGQTTQGTNSVAVGNNSGNNNQGASAVAIGNNAGQGTTSGQGANAIAIGNNAGVASQTASSICLNASGAALNPNQAGLFIDPIRNVDVTDVVGYNPTTKEVTYFDETNLFSVGTPTAYSPVITDSGLNTLNISEYNIRISRYVKMGRLVYYQGNISITGKSGILNTNILRVSLPFTSLNATDFFQSFPVGRMNDMTTNIVSMSATISPNTDFMFFWIRTAASTTATAMTVGDVSNTWNCRFGGFYFANS